MSQQLISHSPDLLRLLEEGFNIQIKDNHLLVHDIPFVNSDAQIEYATLVDVLNLEGGEVIAPKSHTAYFTGSPPCFKDGSQMGNILNNTKQKELCEGVVAQCYFSSKLKSGKYPDYYTKVTHYAEIISAPAKSLDPTLSAKRSKQVVSEEEDSVFVYPDTNSSRVGITAVSQKLAGQRIGIIGCGGTGAYILDAVAKTPVAEIHLFDGDTFHEHNAFRAPGAAPHEVVKQGPPKVSYWAEIYSNMHRGIHAHLEYLTEKNLSQLDGLDFIFVSIDRGSAKARIVDYLEQLGKPFIDVGIGANEVDGSLIATVRVTTSLEGHREHFRDRVPLVDNDDDVYSSNIQISELNMLNAAMAVIRWKRLAGFYHDQKGELDSAFSIELNLLSSNDLKR